MGVVMGFVRGEDLAEVAGVEDEYSVEEFSTATANPAFHDRVRTGCLDRSPDDLYALAGEDRVERAGELRVPVADHEPELRRTVAEIHDQVAGLLSDPVAGGMFGDAEDVYPAGWRARPPRHSTAWPATRCRNGKNRRPGSLPLLPGHTQDHRADRRPRGWTPRSSPREGP